MPNLRSKITRLRGEYFITHKNFTKKADIGPITADMLQYVYFDKKPSTKSCFQRDLWLIRG